METNNSLMDAKNRQSRPENLGDINQLYYGDNLKVLKEEIASGTVDLCYIDPPFNSARDYFVIFKDRTGEDSQAQDAAFEDTWTWTNEESLPAYQELLTQENERLAHCIEALRMVLDNSPMMAYLVSIAQRLVEIHRVLKPTGSFYLHCDQTASHYLKILCDAVFSPRCFRNEIIWSYRRWPSTSHRYQRMHDVILYYTRSASNLSTFNVEYEPNSESYEKRFKGKTQILDPESRTRKITVDEPSKGLPRRDVWEMSILAGSSKERLGYPTQKPLALLRRIIETSSNPGDVVLDCYCGCGTTVHAAHELGRRWVGIDITPIAISVIKARLEQTFDNLRVPVYGFPVDLEGAKTLFSDDPYKFQLWACSLIGAFPGPKGSDRGVDGTIPFFDYNDIKQSAVVQIKGGKIAPTQIRDLAGTLVAKKAAIGIFICLQEPTKAMYQEAIKNELWDAGGGKRYPKIQVLTVKSLLDGSAHIQMPIQEKKSMLGFKATKGQVKGKQTAAKLTKTNGQVELSLD